MLYYLKLLTIILRIKNSENIMYVTIIDAYIGVGDCPEGSLKQPGESCLKTAKNQNETSLT
jgi:hypothetical protein